MSAINRLKEVSARQTVLNWLDSINERDEECRKEVIDLCSTQPEYRKWLLSYIAQSSCVPAR